MLQEKNKRRENKRKREKRRGERKKKELGKEKARKEGGERRKEGEVETKWRVERTEFHGGDLGDVPL